MQIAIFEPNFLTPAPNASLPLVLLKKQVDIFGKLGHEVTVFAEGSSSKSGKYYDLSLIHTKLTFLKSYFSAVHQTIPAYSGFFSPSVVSTVIHTLKQNPPDVLYTCGTLFSGIFSAIIGCTTGIPNVHYSTDSVVSWRWWRGDLDTFEGYELPLRHILFQILKDLPRELVRREFIARWALKNITQIIPSSEYTKKGLEKLGLEGGNMPVVYPWVEIPRLNNTLQNPDVKCVTYLGHLWQGRGVLDLVRAFSIVVKKHSKAKLVVAANNVHPLTNYYFERLIAEYHLESKVIYRGIVEDPFSELLVPSTAIVLPYRDTPSIKLIEVMAAAKPVITTKLGWAPELICDGVSGFLVEVGDIKGIASRLNLLLGDPELTREVGQNAREVIKKTCSSALNATKILDVLKEAINIENTKT